jgi:hypothetical protein
MVEHTKGVGADEKEGKRERNKASHDDGHGSRAWIMDANELYIAMRDMFAGTLEDMLKVELDALGLE